jgi:hypothetical protein
MVLVEKHGKNNETSNSVYPIHNIVFHIAPLSPSLHVDSRESVIHLFVVVAECDPAGEVSVQMV